jgi:hypothetical protein
VKRQLIHALEVGSAILTLAGRTLEEDLQPQREINRLESYLARLEMAKQQFTSTQAIRVKIAAMRVIVEALWSQK